MQNRALKPILEKAKEQEKRYEWLQATEFYNEATKLALEGKDFVKAAEFQEQFGFCLYLAADQAETNIEFRKLMKQAIQAYRNELKILEEVIVEDKQVRIDHAHALAALVEAVLERNSLKKKKLLDKWWTLENQVISAHESSGDLNSAGKVCNELLEYSREHRFWLVLNYSEWEQNKIEYINLSEKAVKLLSQSNDDYELTRAYYLAAFYYCLSGAFGRPEEETPESRKKVQEYSKNALELSQKIGDPWLFGESYVVAYWMTNPLSLRDPALAMDYCKKAIKYGKNAKNYSAISRGNLNAALLLLNQALVLEDPDKQKESLKKAIRLNQKVIRRAKITENVVYCWVAHRDYSRGVNQLASIETDPKTKQDLLEMAITETQEGMERLRDWKILSVDLLMYISPLFTHISLIKSGIEEKRKLLQKAEYYLKEFLILKKKMRPIQSLNTAFAYFQLAHIQNYLATIETDDKFKIELLKQGVKFIEKAIGITEKLRAASGKLKMRFSGMFYDFFGGLLVQINLISKQENTIHKAIDSYQKASINFEKLDMPTHEAESHWHRAQLEDELGEYQKASKKYELASQSYDRGSKKISQLSEFYGNYSKYMLAWSQIEQAKYLHSIEDYLEARKYYEKAARLHETINPWNYLAPNYYAWTYLEEAESLSRKESVQKAKHAFEKALKQFALAEDSIRQKLEEITSPDEKEMTYKLLETSGLRRKYCQARILLEDAKLLDRQGKYLQSSKSYKQASNNLKTIIEKIDNETERNELKLLAILCQAWERMANAEEATSSESYIEAAELFEQAKELCYTKKASLWTLANSNFCKGLAAGIRYQGSMNLKENAKAKQYIKNSASNYLQAGFKNASEYAKATQRLFDAYTFMNQAENEIDPEKKTKQYQMAENLLEIAAGSFVKAKQPEKKAQVHNILANVKEEKALAVSLSQVMQAPTIASSIMSFSAPTPTSETSVGLEKFEHANVQVNLVTQLNDVRIGESFCLSLEFVNAGREPALLMRVDNFIPLDFVVVKKPEIYRLEESCLNMKGKQLAPLKLVEVKLTLQPSKKGTYCFNPRVHYLDERGQTKSLQLKTLEINVEEVILEHRLTTGTEELDSLLLGGIPEEYTVVLSGPPCDERELLIKNFLEVGAKQEEATFHIATEAIGLECLLENPNFFLFLCNSKPKTPVPDLPNVFRVHGKADITNLGIALIKAIRNIDQSVTPKRICIEILPDVLVKHGINTTREWISGLITDLGAKGFTMLVVMNPSMHLPNEANAVLDLFDGEISITQSDDLLDCKKSILLKKLRNQDYIKNPICLR